MAASRKPRGRRFGFSRQTKAGSRRAPHFCRLGFEALEERRLLALIVPAYNSLPGAPTSLYIDFDGSPAFDWNGSGTPERVHGAGDNDAPIQPFTLDGNIVDFSVNELEAIAQVWSDVAEKYSPFNINVTTVVPPNFNDFQAIQMIVGGRSRDWLEPQAPPDKTAGVATGGGFTNNLANQGFAFSAGLVDGSSDTLYVANRELLSETIAHEAGHLFGLDHQSIFDFAGNLLEEYSSGNGLGAPIMGNSGAPNILNKHGIWFDGTASYRDADDNIVNAGTQDDLDHLYSVLGPRADDFGQGALWTTNDNQGHYTARGIIGNLLDTDSFRFTATGSVAFFSMSNQGPVGMLTPRMELRTWPANTPVGSPATTTTDDKFTMYFDNLVIGQQYVVVASSNFTYGSLGNYSISGNNTNEFTYVQDGVLYINGSENVDDDIQLDLHFDDLHYYVDNVVNGNVISVLIPKSTVGSIVINTKSGNDSVRYRSPLGIVPTTLDMGIGTDTLEVRGTDFVNFFDVSDGRVNFDFTVINYDSSVENLKCLGFGGDDPFSISGSGATTVSFFGGNGNDTLNVATAGINSVGGRIKFFGEANSDTLHVNDSSNAAGRSFAVGLGRVEVINAGQVRDFEYDSTTETARVSGGSGDDGFDVQGDLGGQTMRVDGNNGADTIVIGSSPSIVIANGNDGNDEFIVGEGNITGTFPQILNGGSGVDQVTFDDRLDPTSRIWDIRPNEVLFGGLISLVTTGFESVGVLAGAGADEITFAGDIGQNLNIDGGGGIDRFLWNEAKNFYPLSGTYAVNLNGGDGINRLEITQAAQGALTFNVTGSRIYALGDPFDIFTGKPDINYANFIAVVVTAGPQADRFNVYGTVPSSNYTFSGGDGADYFYMQTDPATRNNVTLNGQPGNDTLAIDDGVFANENVPYTFRAASGILPDRVVRDTGPLAITTYGYTSMTSVIVSGTTGNDSFTIEQHLTTIPLTINGGEGNDALEITPVSKNLGANIATGNSMTFNGGPGADYLGLHNDNNNIFGNSYTVDGTQLNVQNMIGGPSFALFMQHPLVEHTSMTGGPKLDGMSIYNSVLGTTYDLNGGPGAINDYYAVGFVLAPSLVSGIHGAVNVDGSGGGADTVDIFNSSETAARTLHIGNNLVGATPGDNLFGAGGYLHYVGVAGTMTVRLGSGADTVYAAPDALTPISITAANPGTPPGDTLNLILSTAQNYVVNGTPASGNVTSTNLKTLSYTGFETGPNIADANFDGDDDVDGADFLAWQRGLGRLNAMNGHGDANNDQDVDGDDLVAWRGHFGIGGAAIAAASSDAVMASLAETALTPGDDLPADLVDLALAQVSASRSIGSRAPRSHGPIKDRINFGGPYDSLRPAVGAVSAARPAARGLAGAGRASKELPVREHDEALLGAGTPKDLIERLLSE